MRRVLRYNTGGKLYSVLAGTRIFSEDGPALSFVVVAEEDDVVYIATYGSDEDLGWLFKTSIQ